MKRTLIYAFTLALCSVVGFSSCTKDYDDDLRIQRELIENNEKELRALIDAYQVLVDNTIKQMEIAYKNADELIRQQMQAEFDAAKKRLTDLETALAAAEGNIAALQSDLAAFKAAVNLDFQRINAHIAAINARIDDADKKIAALDTRLTTIEGAIVDMKAWKTLAEAKLAELERSQEASKTEIEALKTRIAAIEARITALETRLTELQAAMNAADAALGARIDDLTAQLGVQETSLTALITSVQTALTDKMNDFKQQMTEAFNEHKDSVDAELMVVAEELADLVNQVNDMTASIAELSGAVDDLQQKVAELTAQIAGLASAADLQALTEKVNELTVALKAQEALLKIYIDNNSGNIEANKEAIEALKAMIDALRSELEQKIEAAIADKVTKTEMDTAIDQITADYQAADEALQALIDTLNNTTIPALESRLDGIEEYITGLQDRIQALKWVPDFSDGALTLTATKHIDETHYISAVLSENLYIACNAADIIDRIIAQESAYTCEVIVNAVTTRGIVPNPFGTARFSAGVASNTLMIEMDYTDLASLWDTFNTEQNPRPMGLQLAVKITDDKGNTAMTDFADVVIVNEI